MAQPLTSSMPEGLDLDVNYQLVFAAVDPVTGDDVAGVVVSDATLVVTQLTPGGPEALQVGPFRYVPGPDA